MNAMRQIRQFGPTIAFFCICFPCSSPSQIVLKKEGRDIASELLKMPYRGENENHDYWDNIYLYVHPEFQPQRPPKENTSLYSLANYWKYQTYQNPEKLSQVLRIRLLEACEAFPEDAADLAHLTPRTQKAYQRLRVLMDRVTDKGDEYSSSRRRIQRYLSQNTDWFRDVLIAHAKAAYEGKGFIENEQDIRALARLDWEQAAPILRQMLQKDKPRLSALALSLQYQHSLQFSTNESDSLRKALKAIAADKDAPAKARDLSIEALMASPWADRDDWFLSLLSDGSLAAPIDDTSVFSPLEDTVHLEPSHWIPRIAPLVASSNPNIRKNAIYILVSFQQDESRPDAAIPLLPWLFNPKWVEVEISSYNRLNLIYSLSRMKVPESIPGLIHILQNQNDDDMFEIEYAADAIAQFHDKNTASVLRAQLRNPINQRERKAIANALLASGDVSFDEKLIAVAAAAKRVSSQSGRKLLNESVNEDGVNEIEGQDVLGLAIIESEGDQPSFINALQVYSRKIYFKTPETSKAIDQVLAILPNTMRDAHLLAAIRKNSVSPTEINNAFQRRAWLCKSNEAELRTIVRSGGSPAALAAVLLGDSELYHQILTGGDAAAQRTLLAALRISGDLADDDAVAKLTESTNPGVAEAAKAYGEILWQWHHTI